MQPDTQAVPAAQPANQPVALNMYFRCVVTSGAHKIKFGEMVKDEKGGDKSLTICELCGMTFLNEIVKLQYASAPTPTPAPTATQPEQAPTETTTPQPPATMPNQTPEEMAAAQAATVEPTGDAPAIAATGADQPTAPAGEVPAAQ